ncbi:DUF1735 domain-containing protein [Flavisolibacter sp. BT320]|nr:DUF1735 domain-containing protein [Flavisolibacter longurius]
MKRNKVFPFATLFAGICVALSCNKPKDVVLENEGSIYMPQAAGTRSVVGLQLSTKPQEVAFGAAYGGLEYSKAENAVTFKLDTNLVATYNAQNGTAYKILPDSVYTLSGLSSVIRAGATSSDPLLLNVATSRMRFGVRYMLPITLVSAGTGVINPQLQTTFFRFDTILRKSVDVTGQGTLGVSNENGGGATAGEGSPKLVDGDVNTKYLYNYVANSWFELKFPTAVAVGAYTFTSANDASTRDPKNWTLQGSNDGTNWTVIDTRVDESFVSRFQTKRYEIAGTPAAYTQYRVVVSANSGSSLFQMAEWRMFRYE